VTLLLASTLNIVWQFIHLLEVLCEELVWMLDHNIVGSGGGIADSIMSACLEQV
jgi:hypothetical protein